MAHFRKITARGKKYLQYVQSYRNKKKQPATRILASLGNISRMSEEEIECLTLSFIRAVGMESKFSPVKFDAGAGYHYGTILPVIALWEELGISGIINGAISDKVEIPVSQISLIQSANRFSCPSSKLACYRWYYNSFFSEMKNFVKFPERHEEQLHTYYRSLDYLCEAKEEIEQELYFNLREFGVDTSLILYDITSSYFEGSQAEIAHPGYSRDHRKGTDQIVIGLVMSRDGIPIAHRVFEGNRLDKTTVKEVVIDLRSRFGITNAIFVGDKGMLTIDNIEDIKDQDYDYILGLQSRNRKVIGELINKVCERVWLEITEKTIEGLREEIIEGKKLESIKSLKSKVFSEEELKNTLRDEGFGEKEVEIILSQAGEPEKTIQEFGYADLSSALQKKYSEKVRFVACYNPKIALQVKKTRKKNFDGFKKLIKKTERTGNLDKVKEAYHNLRGYLSRKHMIKFYNLKIKPVYQPWEPAKNKKNPPVWFKIDDKTIRELKNEISSNKLEIIKNSLTDKKFSEKELKKFLKKLAFTGQEIKVICCYAKRLIKKKLHYNFWGQLFYFQEQSPVKTKILNIIGRLFSLPLYILDDDEFKEGYILEVREKSETVAYEAKLDGRYFIQTEVSKEVDGLTIDQSYKTLAKVERAFRIVKDEFDIRPINVRKETRIRGHVMICYFALLIESLIEKKVKELFGEAYEIPGKLANLERESSEGPLTMTTLFEQLDTIRLIPLQLSSETNKEQKTVYISTKISNNVKELFKSLGIRNPGTPDKLSFNATRKRRDKKQLLFNLGGDY